ncbi:MAG: hypothetical protein HQL26_01680 [Candidatus Omnitrophica bacterium]|nr:hypothetical protein [Candidatus Omnitrophota bacterium]
MRLLCAVHYVNVLLTLNRGKAMIKKLKNDSGIVLVTVIIIITVMMILVVSMISLNVSQSVVSKEENKKLKCELMTEGILNLFQSQYTTKVVPLYPAAGSWSCPGLAYNAALKLDYCKEYTIPLTATTDMAGGTPVTFSYLLRLTKSSVANAEGTFPISVVCNP